jgi:hypothetical protein
MAAFRPQTTKDSKYTKVNIISFVSLVSFVVSDFVVVSFLFEDLPCQNG